MIALEHFIYGLFKNSGYQTVSSAQVEKLLKKESIETLKKLQLKNGQKTDVITMLFPLENVVTRSYLHATNDMYGRKGIINHTVILQTNDFIREFPEVLEIAFAVVKDKVETNLASLPSNLDPLKIRCES